MKNRRGLTAVAMAGMMGAITLASSFSAYAATGWVQSGNTYVYYDSDGIYSVCGDYFVQVVYGYIGGRKTYFSTDLVSRNDISLQCIRMA